MRIKGWPLPDLRHAFELDEYPVTGTVSGEYHLYGPYHGPFGFGRTAIDRGEAYGEPFDTAAGSLRFEGAGVRIDGMELRKSGGTVTGAAYIGWNGAYSFNADGRRIPMESVAAATFPQAPLTGLLAFTASGSGTFEAPRYELRGRIRDLFILDEGVGEVTGRLDVRGTVMTVDLEAASPRLAVSGAGRIALTPQSDAELIVPVHRHVPGPRTSVRWSRACRRSRRWSAAARCGLPGSCRNPDHLLVDATFEQARPAACSTTSCATTSRSAWSLDQGVVRVDRHCASSARDTQLDVAGSVDLRTRRIAGTATGRGQPRASCRASTATSGARARPS